MIRWVCDVFMGQLHIDNILKDMENVNVDGYLLSDFSNIRYLTGYMPTSFAFLVIKEDPVVYVSSMDGELAREDSSVEVKNFESFSSFIGDLKSEVSNLAIEPTLPFESYEKFKDDFNVSCEKFVNKQRAVKTSEEIFKIEEATDIAQQAFREVNFIEKHDTGVLENIAAYELGFFMRSNGGECESFDTIVTSGSNSSLPHATPTSKSLKDPILIDWGSKYQGYCSDNTRTIIYSEKQHEIFDIVKESHNKAIQAIKPGVRCCEIDRVARDIITEYGYGDNFIHSTGHSLGLDIHEYPSFSSNDNTILENGMVMTVEPGIYIEGEFGVRLEDSVKIDNIGRILGKLPLKIE